MAAAAHPIVAKLEEIQAYLERRKAKAGEDWEKCFDLKNRIDDFTAILDHFQRIIYRPPTSSGHKRIDSNDATLPEKNSAITWGLISNEYLNLRRDLQGLTNQRTIGEDIKHFKTYIDSIARSADDSIAAQVYRSLPQPELATVFLPRSPLWSAADPSCDLK